MGDFLLHVKFPSYLFFSVLSIFSIFLHRQLQESKLWSTEVLLGKYFILRFFLSSLLESNTEHVNFGVLFQVFSKLTWKQSAPQTWFGNACKEIPDILTHALYTSRYSIVLTTLKLMLKLKCYSAYYWICLQDSHFFSSTFNLKE